MMHGQLVVYAVPIKITSMESANALNENPIIVSGATTTELRG